MEKIKIRPYKSSDQTAVAMIMAQAFKQKFSTLSRLSNKEVSQLFIDLGIIYDKEQSGYFVAECGGKAVGVIFFNWKGKKKIKGKNKKALFFLIKNYGLLKVLHLLLGMGLLEESVKENELYIEFIAVAEGYRSLGIGRQLLSQGIELGKILNLDILSLYVASNNKRAIQLYLKKDFLITHTTSSFLTRTLLKNEKWNYMIYPINNMTKYVSSFDILE